MVDAINFWNLTSRSICDKILSIIVWNQFMILLAYICFGKLMAINPNEKTCPYSRDRCLVSRSKQIN